MRDFLLAIKVLGSFFFVLVLFGCGGGSSTPSNSPSDKVDSSHNEQGSNEQEGTEVAPQPAIVGLRIIPTSLESVGYATEEVVGRLFMYEVVADLDNGGIADVTPWVTWQIIQQTCAEDCVLPDMGSNRLRANDVGTVEVTASFGGLTTTVISLEVIGKLGLCGGEIDDNGTNLNECLKIIEGKLGNADGKWFTSPPTRSVVDLLGYFEVNKGNSSGRSFASFYTTDATGFLTPPNTEYALMRYDGEDWEQDTGKGGQYARYCADLGEMRFNGRDNWRTAESSELQDLFWGEERDLYNRYYWPANSVYISTTRHLNWPEIVMLSIYPLLNKRDEAAVSEVWRNHYPSCVSELL
ncbi:hypothetical protein [Vibrio barjaei]|uniref:DUF1566 domain-containing protein n=1 Tax=Vibrio barjaei TaxID=1676683 RepID=A0ABW7IP36_9VIBR|nr:hypothetical protein [Vibrio barjaei]MCY9870065.1 hypothetical protein [Vibrio barjaei]